MKSGRISKKTFGAMTIVLLAAVLILAIALPTTAAKYVKEYEFSSVPINVYQEGYVPPSNTASQNTVTTSITLIDMLNTSGNKVYEYFVTGNRLNQSTAASFDSDGGNYGAYVVPTIAAALSIPTENQNDFTFSMQNYKDGTIYRLDVYFTHQSVDGLAEGTLIQDVYRDRYVYNAETSAWDVDPSLGDYVEGGTMKVENVTGSGNTFQRLKKNTFTMLSLYTVTRE